MIERPVADADSRRWWKRAPGRRQQPWRKELHHPLVGDLTLDWGTFTCAADPDQQLIVWTAEPGSPTREALWTLAAKVTEGGSRCLQPPPPPHGSD
jgi:hypothetical protein